MNRIDNATIAHNMKWGLILIGALVIALLMGTMIASDMTSGMMLFSVIVFPLVWIMIGAKHWWLPIPFALALGGHFQFGFRILPVELAIVLALVTLAVALPLRWRQMYTPREMIHLPIVLLCAYLLLHWGGSLIYNSISGIGGYGNATRSYSGFLWPVVFIIAFHLFGKTSQIKALLWIYFGVSFARICLTYVCIFIDSPLYIPVINYVPQFTLTEDLRHSGPNFAISAVLLMLLSKSNGLRGFFLASFVFGCIATLFGGGRGGLAMFALCPVFLLILYRRWLTLGSGALLGIITLLAVNANPVMLDTLPAPAARSLSILILKDTSTYAKDLVRGSNEFHENLAAEGKKRWLASWNTIVFGTGIRPYNKDLNDPTLWSGKFWDNLILNAANTGAYEKGLWSVLTVTGVTGFALHLLAFFNMIAAVAKTVLRHKIRTEGAALAFWGSYSFLAWLIFCPVTGGLPNVQLFLLYLGYAWIRDHAAEKVDVREEARQGTGTGSMGAQTQFPGYGPEAGKPVYS